MKKIKRYNNNEFVVGDLFIWKRNNAVWVIQEKTKSYSRGGYWLLKVKQVDGDNEWYYEMPENEIDSYFWNRAFIQKVKV